jgi:hypothetical protein
MRIGIIGAGQLGRMLALAGYPLALQFRFLDSTADSPGAQVAPIVLGSGKTGLNLNPIAGLDQALRPLVRTMRFKDGDMLCMCDMRRPIAA